MELSRAWGNEGYSADPEFLEESLRRVAAGPGTVLECGSGLSTVLMAIVGRATNTRIWSLEHNVGWFARVRSVLNRFRLRGTHLILSPLRSYGDFMWYEPPWSKLPHRFDLVICDGPPEETSGGRFGLVPLIRSRLSPGAVLLVDDAATETGGRVLTRWRDEFGAQILTRIGPFAAYAVLTFQPRTTPEPIQDLPLKTKA
jgi:predicted O-methyltransferase YrrM